MKITILELGARSISIEIESKVPYASTQNRSLRLNGHLLREEKRNVVTLFGLTPKTAYTLEVSEKTTNGEPASENAITGELRFETQAESYTLDVRKFGATGDGETDDTQAIQAALYACPPEARVLIPAGTYCFTSLYFKSHTSLEIQKGAVLKAQPQRKGRAILPGLIRDFRGGQYFLGTWEGNPLDCYAGLFTLLDVEDVHIFGEGRLDGGGSQEGWWRNPKERDGAWRPRSIFLRRCKKIVIQGIEIVNSPSWTIHPVESEDLCFINVTIRNPWDSPNTDGINPESCKNVSILGCHFSLGDDCIALKSGKIYMAETSGIPTENVTIRNCLMEDGHGAVTIGSEMASGIYDIDVSLCVFRRTDRGLRIKTRRGRGRKAIVDNISFSDIVMEEVGTPIVVNMFYFCDPDGHSPYVQTKEKAEGPAEALPEIGKLVFTGITCKDSSIGGLFAYGLPEKPIREFILQDVSMTFVPLHERPEGHPAMLDDDEWEQGGVFYAKNIRSLTCERVTFETSPEDYAVLASVEDRKITDSTIPEMNY